MSPILPTMLNYTEVALTWRELGYAQPRYDDVVAIVRQFHHDSLLAVLIRLNLALTHARGPSQEDIVRKWLVPDKADAVVRLLRQGPPTKILFHEGQVLNVIRLALLYCHEDEGLRLGTMGELELLTRALLMLSALMFPEAPDDLRRAGIFSTMTRGEVFRHDESYLPNIISRCYDLFVALPPIVQSAGPLRDLRGLFHQATRMEFEDYFALAFGVLAFYDNLDPRDIGNAPVGVQRAAWLRNTLIGADIRDRLWTQLSLPLHRYREEVRAEWERAGDAASWAAMRVFSEHPMIEFPDASLVCLSRRLLRDRFTHGIYWIIANSLEGTKTRNTFTNFFGEVFEEYIRRCMLRSLGRGFHAHATYGPWARPLVDGALVKPKSLALMEVQGGAPPAPRARDRGRGRPQGVRRTRSGGGLLAARGRDSSGTGWATRRPRRPGRNAVLPNHRHVRAVSGAPISPGSVRRYPLSWRPSRRGERPPGNADEHARRGVAGGYRRRRRGVARFSIPQTHAQIPIPPVSQLRL